MTSDVTIRPLESDEWERFRDIRLKSLRDEPQAFGSSDEREAQFDETTWRARLDGARKRVFGLFDGDSLVGVSAIIPDPNDDSGEAAMLVAAYIEPSHRGRGLSALFFEARLAYAEAAGYERVTVAHRESNEPSKRAILRHGFIEIARSKKTWPDGIVEDEIVYGSSLPKNSMP